MALLGLIHLPRVRINLMLRDTDPITLTHIPLCVFRILIGAFALCCFAMLVACNRDPSARKQQYFDSGSRYLEKSEFPEAVIQFSNAIRLDPLFAAAHFKLAKGYLGMRRFQDAFRELQRTLDLEPGNNEALLDLGALYIAGRAYDQVEPIASRMFKHDPGSADGHLLLAELNQAQGKTEAALREINQAIVLNSMEPKLYLQLATLQATEAKRNEAENSLRKALAIDPKFIPAIQAFTALDETSGRLAEAEQRLRYLIQLQPMAVEPREHLALLYHAQRRDAEAEQVMIQAKRDFALDGDHYRILGEYYEKVGDGDKALLEFASIAYAHQQDFRTRDDYIRLLFSHHKFEEAEKLTNAILEENPNDSGAQIIRGTLMNSRGEFNSAIGVLESAVKNAPDDANGHYQLGLALKQTGYTERAEEEWRRAAKLQPRMIKAQLALAQIARVKRDRQLLNEAADQIIQSDHLDPRGYVLRAEAEVASRQMTAAQADLERVIEVAPRNPVGYLAMGNFLRTEAHNREAREYYEKALECDPGNVQSLSEIASILNLQNQNAQALERVKSQILMAPNSDEMYALLGRLQAAKKDMAAAKASLQKSVQLNPNNLNALVLLSKIEIAQGDVAEALATSYKSIKANPTNVVAYYFAGTMEEMRGNPQQAKKAYRGALQVDPDYAPAANNLAYLLLQSGENTDEALSLAQLARQEMPDSPSAADTLAWAYYEKGIYGGAANLLQEALQKSPDNATYHYHIGMVYEKQKDHVGARRHLQRALKISPNSPVAPEIRKALNRMS